MIGRPTAHDRPEPRSGVSTARHLVSELQLAPLPTAIACARLHAVAVLHEWGLHDLADDVALIVSELMTNALDVSNVLPHKPPIALRMIAEAGRLVIEAWDSSPLDLAPIDAGYDAECGRGLAVVEALSHSWGSRRLSRDRKVVWAILNHE